MVSHPSIDRRILIVAPTGGDAKNVAFILDKAGFLVETFGTVASAVDSAHEGCGALLLAEESLTTAHHNILTAMLSTQPKWSNLPLILLTSGGMTRDSRNIRKSFDPHVSTTLLERPLRTATLIAAIETALGSRDQQYEIRDLLHEREKLLNSLEERVRERTAKLQAMVQEMEAFSYSVSHDLRAPLRVLAGYAEAVREDYAASLPAEGHRLLERISTAAKRMDRLTQDLLAYTRISSGELVLERIDLDNVIDEVMESYPSLQEAGQHIQVEKPLGICLGHAPSLAQCFSNLLENAVKFAKPGRPPEIEVRSKVHDDKLRVSVIDHGIGIAPGEGDRIFGLFERGGTNAPGTGIGLAIVKKGAERMKGQAGLISIRGQKTEFWIELHLNR
jgi:signal transduction histidine kinase